MKKIKRAIWAVVVVLTHCLTSCGLINIEFDPDTQTISNIAFNYDDVYVMEGDTFFLKPYIYPDDASSKSLYWGIENTDVVEILTDTIVAKAKGTTDVIVMAKANQKSDTCTVHVMAPWAITPYELPYDMVVYAEVDLGVGLSFNPNSMIVGAFQSEGQCVGVGEEMETKDGKKFLRIRCWGNALEDEDAYVYFMIYYKKSLQIGFFEQDVPFDGQTHGMPSNPVKLTLVKQQ